MGFGSYIKNTVKNNTNVKNWSAWDAIKTNAKTIVGMVKEPVSAGAAQEKRTFDETMKEYGLSENDIQVRMNTRFRTAIGCFLLALIAIGWTIYLFITSMYLSSIVALTVAGLMSAYAFREHFYYFQMKKRKLNCTFKDWLSNFFSHKK